ncbi:MAG TPA: UPF0182 family protein, partial [Gemmatimonadaceae bacterium]|nr:UPF0182 family protein [Gemmatimonadaceae bacterium]
GFLTDRLWFGEIGFSTVFFTSLDWRAALFVLGGIVALAFFYGNLVAARQGTSPVRILEHGEIAPADAIGLLIPKVLVGAAFIGAFIAGTTVSALWMTYVTALRGVSVGTTDPLFHRDIGFYLFRVPAIDATLTILVTMTVLALIAVTVLYASRGAVVISARRMSLEPRAARHIGVLVALFFVLTAAQLWIVDTAGLLLSTRGPLVGASYADVHAALPGIRLSAVVAVLAAGIVVVGAFRGTFVRDFVVACGVYVVVAVVGRAVVPYALERLVVVPNELDRETPYLRDHVAATRRAWRLDSIETRDLSGEAHLTMADIRANAATIGNVRLWERDLLKQTFGQLQEIRTYYDFVSVNDDRYMIDGQYRQVHLAARELNTASLPTRNFINDRLTFTHGMGITMAPVNQVTDEGLPVLFIKDLPPVSTISITLTRPQIYYGQLTNDYVFVGTGQKEFDSPGDTDRYTHYAGVGGVPIGSFFRRALYAWDLGSLKILLSNDLGQSARILYRRNITDRASAALPFLTFDAEPYLVVNDSGQLKWMLDAYTRSLNYPYSQPVEDGTNYMRNSVKVVIDAYEGTVDAYVVDPGDPLIRTDAAIFPGVLKPLSAMPADLRRHMRYPGELFRLQTQLQTIYHMVAPDAFYHREDQWQIPEPAQGQTTNPFMRHIIMRLPGETKPEFIYMTPFTPKGKLNLAAWMAARMDGDNYGKLVAYRFPKQSLVYGPQQITNRIDQDPDISQQITLWDQKGSHVIRGELLVIPIEESLIYVQPIYLQAEGGNIPELKRVVVAEGDRVVMAETLDEGLSTLFGVGATSAARDSARAAAATIAGAPGTSGASAGLQGVGVTALLKDAQQAYDAAIAAERSGNWAEYGRQIDRLGAVLKQLRPPKS